ncbi:MAG: hypothetical protein HKO95_06110 [Rhodobacteraceae bacterium]|nr:hypothetical protein [Alphaproteobacteria bacterium]MBT8476271.1 hypothetical protein [Alphaproteobacteria bacterium]NNK66293.1 hypothetical protein [Paracoccaceae bacterium]
MKKSKLVLGGLALVVPSLVVAAGLALMPTPALASCTGTALADGSLPCEAGSNWDAKTGTCALSGTT